MARTRIPGQQITDGSIGVADLESSLQDTINGKVDSSSLADVATSGDYTDLTNTPTIPSALNDLSDVAITTPSTDQVLKYDGTGWVNAAAPAGGASSLDELSDVAVSSAVKGQFIVHDGTQFVNSNTIEASGAAAKPLVIKGATSQTANLLEVQDSAGTVLSSISSAGAAYFASNITTVGTITFGIAGSGMALKNGGYNGVSLGRSSSAGESGLALGSYVSCGSNAMVIGWGGGGTGRQIIGLSTGEVGIGTATPGAQLHLIPKATTMKGLIVQGLASQTANLFELQNSSSIINCAIADSGAITTASNFTVRANNSSQTKFLLTTGAGIGASLTNRGFVMLHQVAAETQMDFMTTADASETLSESMMCFNLVQNQVGFNTPRTSIGGQVHITSKAAARKGLVIKGAASQTANLLEVQDSADNAIFTVDPTGTLNIRNTAGSYLSIGLIDGIFSTLRIGRSNGTKGSGYNLWIGDQAGFRYADNSGSGNNQNTGVGHLALRGSGVTTAMNGNANVALGYAAGQNVSGTFPSACFNTLIGASTAQTLTTGSSNIVIGWEADCGATANYQIALGVGAETTGADAVAIGRNASAAANCMDIRFGNASRITGDSSGNVAIANTLSAKRYTETATNAFNTALSPSSGTLTVDSSLGNAVLGALNASVTTWAFTNVPTDNSKITTVTTVLEGNTSYTYGDACSVNGTAVADGIKWSGGSAPVSTAGTDIITFIIVKDSAGDVKVFGSATTNFS